VERNHEELLRRLALNDEGALTSVLRALTTDVESSSLDAKTYALVRLAGLFAVESATASYAWSVSAALTAGATDEEIIGVLVALAPLVGVARVNWAASELAAALGFDLDLPTRS
jgi:4-carboxymuconolactone decarboxylase